MIDRTGDTPHRDLQLRPEVEALPRYRAGVAAPAGAYKISSNENPYPPLPSVVAAMVSATDRINRYPDFSSARLVARLAERHGVPEEHVAVGTGSVAVCQQLVQALAGAGEEVVYAWRSFEAYPILVQVAGAVGVPVPLRPDESHDLPAMAAAVSGRTRLILVCNPNNPTGVAIGRSALVRFLDAVPDDVVVVIDEAYREFVRDPDVPDALDLYRDRPNVAVLRTFSKAYGLAGARVGFAIAHPWLATGLRSTAVPFGVSTLAQDAAVASLDAEPELLERVVALLAERDRVRVALRAQGWPDLDSQANFVWLRLGERTDAFARACAAGGVVVRPFAGEGVRVTIAEPEASDRFLAVAGTFAD